MARTFQPEVKQQPMLIQWGMIPQAFLQWDAVMYPRVSTPGQKNNVSSEMQLKEDGELWRLALQYGWKQQQIRCPKDDMALSGRLRMEERPAFKLMLHWIITDQVKAVISVQVDRLFRDKWGTEYSKFMEICEANGVIVITPDMVYNFKDPNHVKIFRDRCVQAWEYLDYQVYKRMLGAKDYLGETGRWAGSNLPPGYIVDRNRKSPTFRKLLQYPLWAEIVLGMFERYRELNDNLMALHREYDAKPFMFPDFEDWIDPEIVAKCKLKKVPGGYTMSLSAMQRMLCNPVYIGWWIYDNTILVDDNGLPKINHEPIIPLGRHEELFWHAFRQRSPYNIDGTKNELAVGQRPRRYTQVTSPACPAILKPIVHASDTAYTVRVQPQYNKKNFRTGKYLYALRKRMNGYSGGAKYMLSTDMVDTVFLQQLMRHLWETEDFTDYAITEEVQTKEKEQEKAEISAQIAACDRKLTKLLKRLIILEEDEKANDTTDEEQVTLFTDDDKTLEAKAAEEALKKMIAFLKQECQKFSAEKMRLQARLEKLEKNPTNTYAAQMITYHELLREVGEQAREIYTIEELIDVVTTFATHVCLDTVSPRVWKMTITWRDTAWGHDEVACVRLVGNPSLTWTEDEKALLTNHYASSSRRALLEMLPNRSWISIRTIASELKLRRHRDDSENAFSYDLCFNDWLAIQEYDLAMNTTQSEGNTTVGVKLVRSWK